jgi:hypothetical protein
VYKQILHAQGLKINFSSFPHMPQSNRMPYDCPHMSWLSVNHPLLVAKELGGYILRAKRYIIEDNNGIAFAVGDYYNQRNGFIIYEDMQPTLLGNDIQSLLQSCPEALLETIFYHCYPEDILAILYKYNETGFNFEKLTEYILCAKGIMSFNSTEVNKKDE